MQHYFKEHRIRPQGWFRQQLEIQAKGLSGNLDKFWPDIKDSAWIGGDREGWERVPYWLDGFIPLAWFLEDEDMKSRANKYIRAIVERQKEDGWICPGNDEDRANYDVWAVFLIGKVFTVYWEFTGDEEVKQSLYKAMKCLFHMMKEGKVALFEWGKFRWFEALIPLQFLYDEYEEQWILELGEILRNQGIKFTNYIENWKRPLNKWTLETHVVNLAMMLKYEALCSKFFGEPYENIAEKLWSTLVEYNGTAVGTITGDECLAGLKNNQGTELCSVVELMYSFEILYNITKDPIWLERLEKISFNALPATISDDMWTHQYVQQVNQIACIGFPGKSYFRTNGPEAHIFGLEPHFGCCTSNLHQGWPKLLWSAFSDEDGLECRMMLPATYETEIAGTKVRLTLETEYPFRHSCKYIVETEKPIEFSLKIRIPEWSKQYKLDNEAKENHGYLNVKRVWEGRQEFTITLFDEPHLVDRPSGLKVAEYGPLVFSLPIETKYEMHEYERDGVERKFPYCDYNLIPISEWRFGFNSDAFSVCEQEGDEIPFSSKHPRIKLMAEMRPIEWEYEEGYETVAAAVPSGEVREGNPVTMALHPYGGAKLRMTEMPFMINTK